MRRILLLVLLFPLAYAASVNTLSPAAADLCGSYPDYLTLQASITSAEPGTASLQLLGQGLDHVSPQSVQFGSGTTVQSWIVQCSGGTGTVIAYLNFSDGSSSIGGKQSIITLHADEQLSIEAELDGEEHYEDGVYYLKEERPSITVKTEIESTCRASFSDDEFEEMSMLFTGTAKLHELRLASQEEGMHTSYIRCRTQAGTIGSSALDFVIDTKGPQITFHTPGISVRSYAWINITTDEESDCRHSKSDRSYSGMDNFDEDSGRRFSSIVELEEGENDIYVECRDSLGNSRRSMFSISSEEPPKARIELSDESPVKEGLVEVTLKATRELREEPILTYGFTDSSTFSRQVSLVKEGTGYKGFIVIEKSDLTRIGVFSFKGYDLEGNLGTEIIEGKNFLVDTTPPVAVRTVEAVQDDGILLRWYHDGEEASHFNVYRSTSPGVDYIHFHRKVSSDEMTDDAEPGVRYYYRVAAVDSADNIGALSKEVSITAGGTAARTDAPKYETILLLNKTLREISQAELDLEYSVLGQHELAGELGLARRSEEGKDELARLRSYLSFEDPYSASEDELRQALDRARSGFEAARKTIPVNMEPGQTRKSAHTAPEPEIMRLAKIVIDGLNLSEREEKSYLRKNLELQEQIEVSVLVQPVTVTYLDRHEEQQFVIEKTVTGELAGVKILEAAGEAQILTDGHVLIQKGVFGWNIDEAGSFSFSYAVKSDQEYPTVIIRRPDPGTQITGLAIGRLPMPDWGTLPLILGMLVIAGLAAYYVFYVQEYDVRKMFRKDPILMPSHYFYLSNGDVMRSLDEFRQMLPGLQEDVFRHHVNRERNDFSAWVRDVWKKEGLSEALRAADSRDEMQATLKKYLK